jgi:hypothetical protein
MSSNVYKEWDCTAKVAGSVGTVVGDSSTWAASCVQFTTATASTSTHSIKQMGALRYGRYSLSLRAKVSAIASASGIAILTVCAGDAADPSVNPIASLIIRPNQFVATTTPDHIYLPFEFESTSTKNVSVFLQWIGTGVGTTLDVHSIVISPIQLSTYNLQI